MGTFPVKTVDSRKDKETKWPNKSLSLVTITAVTVLLNVQAVRTGTAVTVLLNVKAVRTGTAAMTILLNVKAVRTGTAAMTILLNLKAVRTGTAMAVAERAGCADGHCGVQRAS